MTQQDQDSMQLISRSEANINFLLLWYKISNTVFQINKLHQNKTRFRSGLHDLKALFRPFEPRRARVCGRVV